MSLERARTSREPSPAPPRSGPSTSTADACNRFACPFVKRYGPQGTKGHACTGKGWPTTHRVKQHLYRSHHSLIICPRCHVEFKQQTDLNTHLNSESICDKKPALDNDQATVLTEAQMQELKKKRRGEVNEEEQWKSIYKTIFPNEAVMPSPYVHNAELEFKRHFRARLTVELRKLLVDEVPKDPKYTGVRSPLKSFLESAVDSGLVDTAIDRASHSLKRRRTSSGHEDPRSGRLGRVAIAPKEDEAQDEDEGVEFSDSPPVVLDPPPGQRSHASAFSTDFRGNPSTAFHTPSPWIPVPDVSFSEPATWSFELASVSQPNHTVAPELTEQAADDWVVFPPDTTSPFPSAVEQDQGTYPVEGKKMAANTSFPS